MNAEKRIQIEAHIQSIINIIGRKKGFDYRIKILKIDNPNISDFNDLYIIWSPGKLQKHVCFKKDIINEMFPTNKVI